MPTNKQRREASRRHLERQLERRQEHEAARKRFTLIASIVGSIVVIVAVVVVIATVGSGGSKKHPTAAGSSSPTAAKSTSAAASPTPSTTVVTATRTTGACAYSSIPGGNTELKNVGFPPDPKKTPTTDRLVTFDTNRGTIKMQLDGAMAPCNVQSLAYLIGKKFYNSTTCHRLVTTGIYVLQCGDPTGTGAGGPSYTVKDENLAKVDYTTGVVAMANAGANTNGSQFFIMTKDSSTGLGKLYTEIGKVTEGMNIIQAVAKGGSDNSNGTGDGKPKLALTFKTVTVSPPVSGSGTTTKVQVTETVTPTAAATS